MSTICRAAAAEFHWRDRCKYTTTALKTTFLSWMSSTNLPVFLPLPIAKKSLMYNVLPLPLQTFFVLVSWVSNPYPSSRFFNSHIRQYFTSQTTNQSNTESKNALSLSHAHAHTYKFCVCVYNTNLYLHLARKNIALIKCQKYRILRHSIPHRHLQTHSLDSLSLELSARPHISNNRESLAHILFVNLFSRFPLLSVAAHRCASHSRTVIMYLSEFPIPRANGSFPEPGEFSFSFSRKFLLSP